MNNAHRDRSPQLAAFSETDTGEIETIREHFNLTPDEIAQMVGARTAAEILAYENDEDDLLVTVLWKYSKLAGCPIDNFIKAEDDLSNVPAVRITFTDIGDGISTDKLEKIWEPFFTTKPESKGTGLGMGICRRIVEDHNGAITIASELGQGTAVSIVLPIQLTRV